MKKNVLGIAGYMGSGKTTVAKIFEKYGACRIDADDIVDYLYQSGESGYKKIKDFFGEEYIQKKGGLDRKKLAKVVFSDPKKLKILHALIHPIVTSEIQKKIDKTSNPFIVLEATYFEKKNLLRLISNILWVECPKNILIQRAEKQNISRDFFEKILRIQSLPPKIDYTINNRGTLKNLATQVKKIINELRKNHQNKS